MQIGAYNTRGFYSASATQVYAGGTSAKATASAQDRTAAATIVTLSEAALAAGAEPDFSEIVSEARKALNDLLAEAGRKSPLEGGKLALDMNPLTQRELFSIASTEDGLFTTDERTAASLEMDRRFDAALAGPAAVSEITGDYRALYRAAAAYFDGLGAEQKAKPDWQAARAAIDKALIALAGDRASVLAGIADDPVAPWLAARKTDTAGETETTATLAGNLRSILDKRYAAAREAGLRPTFEKNRSGYFLDLAAFDSRTVSAMALNREGLFSPEEVRAADAEIRTRANDALAAGFKDASRSGDPTAFSRNIIAIYSSMSADERQAAGFSDQLLETAISSYESTTRLMDIMAMGMAASGGSGSGFF